MNSSPPKHDGDRAMMAVFVTLILSTLAVLAEVANEPQIPALPAGGKIYTNAIITRVTPAYVVVNYQEGIVQIPMSDLPPAYQDQFGYTPEKAAQFLDQEKQNQKKERAAVLARQAVLEALAGTNRLIRITTVSSDLSYHSIPFCSADGIDGGILVENLPDSVRQFFTGYGQLQAEIANCHQQLDNIKVPDTNAPPQPPQMGKGLMVENGSSFASVGGPPKDNTAAIRQNLEDRLSALNAQMAQATTNYNLYTTIIGRPTGELYGGKPIWICTGLPARGTR